MCQLLERHFQKNYCYNWHQKVVGAQDLHLRKWAQNLLLVLVLSS